jgi:hypothetical protein
MKRQGHRIFAEALSRHAAEAAHPERQDLAKLAVKVAAPLRVAVVARRGVGGQAVRAALAAVGFDVVDEGAELDVVVLAEAAKPEDVAAVTAARGRAVVVLNKADLTGFGAGGPIAAAQRHCQRLTLITGAPTEPLVALLAVAALEESVLGDDMFDALRVLVDEPADLRTPDAFVGSPHRIPPPMRNRLVNALDLFGVAHAVVTLRNHPGAGPDDVRAVLRRVSGIDGAMARIDTASAGVRYLRVCDTVAALEALAITDPAVAAFLASDDAVLACMSSAVDVVEASGLTVDPGDEPPAHLRRALHWRRYGAGPVAAVHRACAADISRGSLRLLAARRGGSP